MLTLVLASPALCQTAYQQPPDAIAAILDAPRAPSVRTSADRRWMVELDRPSLPPLAELAEPVLKLAGVKIDPRTHGPAREYAYTALVLREVGRARRVERHPIAIGTDEVRVRNVDWHPTDPRFAFTQTGPEGVALWVVEADDPEPRRLLDPAAGHRLHAGYGAPCDWLPGDAGLICKVVPSDLGPPPVEDPVPAGPRIEENLGQVAPARTYQNLLQDAHDEALFQHYLTSALVHVALDGTVREVHGPALIDEATPSPDGQWLLVELMQPPFSTQVPAGRFPRTFDVHSLTDDAVVRLAELPLADDVPIAFSSVRTGRRQMGWRGDAAATLWWVEALDGGDAGAEAEWRDQVSTLAAPFTGDPVPLWRTALRFSALVWGNDRIALGWEYWYKTRQVRTWQLDPSDPTADPVLHWDRSFQDRYSDPGTPITKTGPFGAEVMRISDDGELFLGGRGYSPDGIHPFIDRYDPETKASARMWQSADPYHESLVAFLEPDGSRLLTRRQSADEPPNYHVRRPSKRRPDYAVTDFADWAPQFASVDKELIRYQRADGVDLTATVYLPPGFKPGRDEPLPTLFWAYPFEFKSKSDAGQITSTTNAFERPYGSSPLFFLLAGYAVVDDPTLPIVGEGDAEPNDTFREQLVAGAEAAVAAVVERGITDPDRTVIGGHSYGAFMVANLLAHSDLFRAGIARSGAYNRTLTPFGFQGEERTFWQGRDTYLSMSPFTHADAIDEPLLLIHGAEDSNSGTYPIQSERLYEAIKGHGGTVRWVELPHEDHGYRARQSVGHVLWEMITWSDTYARDAADRDGPASVE